MDPKPFNGNTIQAQAWLFTLKCNFIAVGIIYTVTKAADIEAA